MIKIKIEDTDLYAVYYEKNTSRFQGCQCFKDCTCQEDFIPVEYEQFTVIKKIGKKKTTHHSNLIQTVARINQILTNYR